MTVPPPKVAIAPEPAPAWIRAAVEAGGGQPVAVSEAEGLVWIDPHRVDTLVETLAGAGPELRWVQLPFAGIERFVAAGVFDDGRTWTCGKGVYAEPVAEHALAMGLHGLRSLDAYAAATAWSASRGTSLYDGRVTILGGGGITESLIGLLAPFRVATTVVRRQADRSMPGAARTVGLDRLHEALDGADLVVLALALTPETAGVIAEPELRAMASHAWLVNVARGRHVVTDDLVRALEGDWIGGAALDVTEPEPLPEGHPLWTLPNA